MNFRLITTKNKFSPFFWTQFLGAFNDNLFKNALVVLVAFRAVQIGGLGSSDLIALAGGIFILPFFLFSPLAGQLADSIEKSRLIQMTKMGEIAVMTLGSLGFLLNSYPLLFFVLFLMGTQSAFFGPTKYSVIPEIIPPSDLVQANAFVELGTFAAILTGTILGGLISGFDSAEVWISVGVCLTAGLGYFVSRQIPKTPSGSGVSINWNFARELLSLWRIARSEKSVFYSILLISWFWFFGAAVLSLLPVWVKGTLNGNEGVATFFLALFTLGVGFGSFLAERASRKGLNLGLVPLGTLGLSLFSFHLWTIKPNSPALAQSFFSFSDLVGEGFFVIATIDFFLLSTSAGLFIVPLYTLLQARSQPGVRSRVIAANNIFNSGFMVVASLLLLSLFRMGFSYPQVFGLLAAANIIVPLGLYAKCPEFLKSFAALLKKT